MSTQQKIAGSPDKLGYEDFLKMLISLIEPGLKQAVTRQTERSQDQSEELPIETLHLGIPAALSLLRTLLEKYPQLSSQEELRAVPWSDLDHNLTMTISSLAAISEQAGFEPLGTATREVTAQTPILRDEADFGRTVYLPLVLHLSLMAFAYRQEKMSVKQWGMCESALAQSCGMMTEADRYVGQQPPPNQIGTIAWQSLVRLEYGMLFKRESDIEAQLGLIEKIIQMAPSDPVTKNLSYISPTCMPLSPHPSQESSDEDGTRGTVQSLDLWTFEELSGLGALTNMAIRLRRGEFAERSRAVANYHCEHTQPDYTTSQPWGVFAFIWDPKSHHFAKQQLFDAQAYGNSTHQVGDYDSAGKLSLIAALILVDALAQLSEILPA